MIYKKIDISKAAFYFVSEDCAKALVDWRIDTKKGITQRIFDNSLKKAVQCMSYGVEAEEALDRWMESGWTGMKYVLMEYQRERAESGARSTRDISVMDDLNDRSWVN